MMIGDTLPTLTTERLALRAITPDDADALFGIFGDPAVTRFWSRPPLPSRADAVRLVEEIAAGARARQFFQWGIVRRAAPAELLGTCTLYDWAPAHRRAAVGYALGRAHWGQGLAREAVRCLLTFAFGALQLHRIEADVDPRHGASIRLLETLGFRQEGLLRERYHQSGEIQDAAVYGLLRADAGWLAESTDPAA